jgi:thiol-disulfide isomerase/thioredoxin
MLKITNDMQEVNSSENAVAYFTAVWCQPCKQLKPLYAKAGMTDEMNDYFVIDVDSIDKEWLDLYNIKSVPTIYKMKNGVVQGKITARTSEDIVKQVNGPLEE